MKMKIKGSFELDIMEIPKDLAKDLEKAIMKMNNKHMKIDVDVKDE